MKKFEFFHLIVTLLAIDCFRKVIKAEFDRSKLFLLSFSKLFIHLVIEFI